MREGEGGEGCRLSLGLVLGFPLKVLEGEREEKGVVKVRILEPPSFLNFFYDWGSFFMGLGV